MRKAFTKQQIEDMGVNLLKAFTEAGNTIVTNKDGAETLQKMEFLEQYQEQVQKFQTQMAKVTVPRKPKHKYPSNYTPSPKRHRKPKHG